MSSNPFGGTMADLLAAAEERKRRDAEEKTARTPLPSRTLPESETVPDSERVPKSETLPNSGRVSKSGTVPESGRVPKSETVSKFGRVPKSERVPPAKSERVPPRGETVPESETLPESERVQIRSHYTRLLNVVLDDICPTLPPSAALAYLHLYRLSFGHNRRLCRVSVTKLGERCNIGKTALTAALVHLERRGLITRLGTEYGGKNLNARGAEWLLALPPGTLPESVTLSDSDTLPDSGTVSESGRMKREEEKDMKKAPVAVAPAPDVLSVYDVRRIAARFRELHHGEADYTRERLRRDVCTALVGEGREVDDRLVDEAIG